MNAKDTKGGERERERLESCEYLLKISLETKSKTKIT